MELAIVLSLAASLCTATASICQRIGARRLEHEGGHQVHGFDPLLVFRLARQPAWLLGFCSMLAGFAFQVSALHFGPLALVQPILAVELLFVFGYLATAVIKEFSSHVSGGLAAIFTNWSAYVLMVVGAAAMLLASHAVAAGPLAASQPGFTIGDPVTAVLLGVLVFGERLGASPAALAVELLGLIVLASGVWTLSGSWLIIGAESGRADCKPGESGERATQELIRRSS